MVNVTFTCQQFYGFVLIKENGLDQNTASANKTYVQVNKINNKFISDHITFLKNKFNLEVNEENKKLPYIYWTPKLHKYPFKAKIKVADS